MRAFLGLFVALAAAVQCVWAELVLSASVPEVIRNEEPTVVALTLKGELGDAVISEVRTVLQTPGKRRPKPYANITHAAPEAAQDAHAALLNIEPVYSLPTKTYLVGYSVLVVSADGEEEWVDSEPTEVRVVDPAVSVVKFAGAAAVLAVSVSSLFYASLFMAAPGWWASVLPARLHWILPKPPKKRS